MGFSLVVAHGLLIAVASLVAEDLGLVGFRSCGAQALLLHGTWEPPGPGIELTSPALAGGFFTTEPHQGSPDLLF